MCTIKMTVQYLGGGIQIPHSCPPLSPHIHVHHLQSE
uniref:Uncharacterized protein n=1 Tax=Anguilla anguilla TaxID=7936 RepID=A0A0E9Q2S5_ANGAN